MTRRIKKAIAIAIAAMIALPLSGALAKEKPIECPPVVINISTGVDNSGAILPSGSAELHWVNSQGMNNVTTPASAWASLPGSTWLGDGVNIAGANTDYVYTLSFSNAAPATINFTALGDNYVTINLDGSTIAQTPGGPSILGFQLAYSASYSGGVATGAHTLTATVHNVSNVSGFNLSGTVSYSLVPVTQDLSTGVNGIILSVGTQDPNWSGPADFVDYNTAWDVLSGSTWIGNADDYPAGSYNYSRSFVIPTAGVLDIEGLADNYFELYLDGAFLTQTPGLTVWGFQLPNLATYNGPVSAGPHTLTAVLTNQGGPMGLNIHGSVTYCDEKPSGKCLSDASFFGTYLGGLAVQFYSNNVVQPNTIVTHYWDFGDGNTSINTTPAHTYASPGSYLVRHAVYTQVLDAKGNVIDECKDDKECKLVIDKRDEKGPVELYCERRKSSERTLSPVSAAFRISPNPAQNELHIQGNNEAYELQILSMDGRVVLHTITYTGTENNVNISKLAQGAYIAVIKQAETVTRIRFIKVD